LRNAGDLVAGMFCRRSRRQDRRRYGWLVAFVFCTIASAQSFEVASVKVNNTLSGFSGSTNRDNRFTGTNLPLKNYIRMAWDVQDFQVVGPDLIDGTHFDIEAISPGRATRAQMMLMLQALLIERFELKVHKETRMASAYGMTIAKSGLKIREVEDKGDSSTDNGRGDLTVHKSSMDRFAEVLSRQTDRPVIDQTEKKGLFDFRLKWSLDDTGPSLYDAIQDQLGLKLTPGKYPLEFVVVDHALRIPVEN
jgi:uncharacterized protein (TIGR03435 family)